MKDLTAKDLEKIFSKKQLSSYNRKLKTEYYILKQKYDKAMENKDSYVEKEIERREEELLKEVKRELKLETLKARMSLDMLYRTQKKKEKVEREKNELEIKVATLEAQLEELKQQYEKAISEKDETYLKEISSLKKEIEKQNVILNRNGTNSSIPTSQTPINQKKVIPNSRKKTEKTKGGQIGHKKNKLEKFEENEITEKVYEKLEECPYCHKNHLKETGNVQYKDELDYRIITLKIRHCFVEQECTDCGKRFRKEIPCHLKEENQYGPNIQSTVLGLMNIGNVPINKVKRIISGLSMGEIDLSEGYISKLQRRASKNLETFIEDLYNHIIMLKEVYWDDTVIMVNTKRSCMRFYGNETYALYKAHEKKNMKGLDQDNILNCLTKEQYVVHDHNKVNYNPKYDFMNVECNAHLTRNLEKVTVNIPERTWAKLLKDHIEKYEDARKEYMEAGKEGFSEEEIDEYFIKLNEYVLLGYEENEKNSAPYYSSTEKALLDRIVEYRDNYTYWVLDFGIATTNNLSERALRGIKTKMKVSGQFQNITSAEYYAAIRSYIETCHRNGINEIEALQRLITENPYTIEEILEQKKIS